MLKYFSGKVVLNWLESDNLKTTGWRVFAMRERVNQQSGQECCCCGSY